MGPKIEHRLPGFPLITRLPDPVDPGDPGNLCSA